MTNARETSRPHRLAKAPSRAYAFAAFSAIGWFWAMALVAARYHIIDSYFVFSDFAPLWGWLALPAGMLAVFAAGGIGFVLAILQVAKTSPLAAARICSCLSVVYVLVGLDGLRLLGIAIPLTYWEPIAMIAIGSAAAGMIFDGIGESPPATRRLGRRGAFVVVSVATLSAAGWFYVQGSAALDDFMLGYHDFGHFGRRVVNTWEGRGFLMETPSLPPFWDHFNPGLALLAPLWPLWPDAHLFVFLQALCLAMPAVLIAGIAREQGASWGAATCWSLAYLLLPVTSQLNLNYSYGWHPVSISLPLLFLAALFLLRRHFVLAAATTLLACSFKETVLVVVASLAFGMAIERLLAAKRRDPIAAAPSRYSEFSQALSAREWFVVWGLISIGFLLIYRFAGFAEFQTSRFSNLGDSPWQIALSPILRPGEFWGQIFQPATFYFLMLLLVPLGWQSVLAGRWILLAAAPHILVLLAWKHVPATCIAFQYVTDIVPVLFLALICGGAIKAGRQPHENGASSSMTRLAVMSLVGCAVASVFFADLPWSGRTLSILMVRAYEDDESGVSDANPRARGTPGNQFLRTVISEINDREAAVLASGRIASHLLNVRRLEPVDEARKRWQALAAEAGVGQSPLLVFDWIVLDYREQFQQSAADLDFISGEALKAGFEVQHTHDGIVVFSRPK